MEFWQWTLVAIIVLGGIILVVSLWQFWQKKRKGEEQSALVILGTPEQGRLQRVRKIGAGFGVGRGGGLGLHVPYPEIGLHDLRLADWEKTAADMVRAQQLAEVNAQVGEELVRVAQDINRAKQRAEASFVREAEKVREAFQILGLAPPEIRTTQDLAAAGTQLEAAMNRLANAGVS